MVATYATYQLLPASAEDIIRFRTAQMISRGPLNVLVAAGLCFDIFSGLELLFATFTENRCAI